MKISAARYIASARWRNIDISERVRTVVDGQKGSRYGPDENYLVIPILSRVNSFTDPSFNLLIKSIILLSHEIL